MVNRFMRVMIFFDLPVTTMKKRKQYVMFRRMLIKDGFSMLQYSVYVRIARNYDDAKQHLWNVNKFLPPEGSVRALLVTDKQYESMHILLGEKLRSENFLDTKDFIEL